MATEVEHAERIAVLEVQVDELRKSVDALTVEVRTLVAMLQQAKGARWMLIGLATLGGFVAGAAGKGAAIVQWIGALK